MNLKQLGILIAIVVIVGGAGLVLRNRQNASWSGGNAEAGKKLLGDFPVNDVAHISIRHGTNDFDLVKKDDLWRVPARGDYPANFSQISEFLLKLRDLKVVQSEQAGPTELARLDLAPGQGSNSAVVVAFLNQSNQPIRTLLVGKKHLKQPAHPQPGGDEGFPDGRFVKAGTNSPDVALISDPLDNVDTPPEQWLNKDFIHVEKPKSIEVVSPVATNSWKLTRPTESGDWKLADAKPGEELDSSKTSGVTTPFSAANFTDVLPQSKSAQLGTNKPTIIKIETFDDFAYTFNIGAKTNDDYLVTVAVAGNYDRKRPVGVNEKPEDKPKIDKIFNDALKKLNDKLEQEQKCQGWTYLVPSWEVEPLLKGRSELLAEKKEEPRKEDSKTAEPQSSSAPHSEKSAETNGPVPAH